MMTKTDAISLVREELLIATQKFGKFNSTHEGYGVILEELDELWDKIKKNNYPYEHEAKQVAAMAIRFMIDCC